MEVDVKKRASTTHAPKRDAPFDHIAAQKAAFLAAGNPVIRVDAKKKELIGNFRADGKSWCKSAIEVSAYTFGTWRSASRLHTASTTFGQTRGTSGSAHRGIPQPLP